jgi:hypothetical protein
MAKGWDRASLDFNTRPDKILRDVSQHDLMVPTVVGEGRLRLALLCSGCGIMLSLLWVWTAMMLLSLVDLGPGRWFYPIVAAAAVVLSATLYVFSTWDFERQRRWGREA